MTPSPATQAYCAWSSLPPTRVYFTSHVDITPKLRPMQHSFVFKVKYGKSRYQVTKTSDSKKALYRLETTCPKPGFNGGAFLGSYAAALARS
jgi:hypothetical protein